MKKTFALLMAFALIFNFGCKKDDTSDENFALIKSITYTYPGDVEKTSFEYDTDNRVEKINFYDDNILDSYCTITYNLDETVKLIEGFDENDYITYKMVFTYSQNQASSIFSWYDDVDEVWYDEFKDIIYYNSEKLIEKYENYVNYYKAWELDDSETYEWENSNLVKLTAFYIGAQKKDASKENYKDVILHSIFGKRLPDINNRVSASNISYTITYNYDTKNNPAWNQNINSVINPTENLLFSKNNPISSERIYTNEPSVKYIQNFTYTYNENNYPTEISVVHSSNIPKGPSNYEVEIEYN